MPGGLEENNIVVVSGEIVEEPKFSHEVYGEGFYIMKLKVPRLSDVYDYIPVLLSERLIPLSMLKTKIFVTIDGQYRSYNNYEGSGSKLLLMVFARDIKFIDDISTVKNPNLVILNGFICKKPIYRTTPFGREITDLLLAVNRHYNKSDYIPCIAWGRNARFANYFNVGDNIKIYGRIQSRNYQKKYPDGSVVDKVAYEVSVSKMEVLKRKDNIDTAKTSG